MREEEFLLRAPFKDIQPLMESMLGHAMEEIKKGVDGIPPVFMLVHHPETNTVCDWQGDVHLPREEQLLLTDARIKNLEKSVPVIFSVILLYTTHTGSESAIVVEGHSRFGFGFYRLNVPYMATGLGMVSFSKEASLVHYEGHNLVFTADRAHARPSSFNPVEAFEF